jgi:hypothetical protein
MKYRGLGWCGKVDRWRRQEVLAEFWRSNILEPNVFEDRGGEHIILN